MVLTHVAYAEAKAQRPLACVHVFVSAWVAHPDGSLLRWVSMWSKNPSPATTCGHRLSHSVLGSANCKWAPTLHSGMTWLAGPEGERRLVAAKPLPYIAARLKRLICAVCGGVMHIGKTEQDQRRQRTGRSTVDLLIKLRQCDA